MKYFLAFQKKKALPVPAGTCEHEALAMQINHELMNYGYMLDSLCYEKLSKCDVITLDIIYHDLLEGIRTLIPEDSYQPIYKNFPNSVKQLDDETHLNNAIMSYMTEGRVDPVGDSLIQKTFAVEPIDYVKIGFMSDNEFGNIFQNLLSSTSSISAFDKSIIEWYIDNDYPVDMSKIVFKETLAYVGQKLLDNDKLTKLPMKNATDILRVWSAYSDGDEGLKENTKFKNPTSRQRKLLMNTLNDCYNLEEAFKTHREKWLRMLFYLHPMTAKSKVTYPNVFKYTQLLRNEPKALKTFNSKVEDAIKNKSTEVFKLLSKRMGVFTRRLDHLIREFGETAVGEWLKGKPRERQMIDMYNHLLGRDKQQGGRSAVLASQSSSTVVNYKDLAPLATKVVNDSRDAILENLREKMKDSLGKVFIDKALYYRPLSINNRASSLSLSGAGIGTCENIPASKTIRAYVFWEGRSDIDLSGLCIMKDMSVQKIGWNSSYNKLGVTYSGDNTGNYAKNAEYLDIDTKNLNPDIEWVIAEARIYRGPATYANYSPAPLMGWQLREKPGSNMSWKPDTVKQAMEISSAARDSYLFAYHVPTSSIIYLDVAKQGAGNVSNSSDAIKMVAFLTKFLPGEEGEDGISWDKINQGHVVHMMAKEIVSDPTEADVIFDEHTPAEEIDKYL